jgi:hypothetical protein
MWLLNFILHDMLQVSLTHHHPLSQTWKIQLRKLVVSRLWIFLESSSSCTSGFSYFFIFLILRKQNTTPIREFGWITRCAEKLGSYFKP